jgi:hypothetical protein
MQERQMLVPELRILATSPEFRPKIKRQMKRMRSQMVTFGIASSSAVILIVFRAVSVTPHPEISSP